MDYHVIFCLLAAITALCFLINEKCFKLPKAVGLVVISILIALIVSFLSGLLPGLLLPLRNLLTALDFKSTILNLLLGYLLFAGSLRADFWGLRKVMLPIFYLATLGVLLTTLFSGYSLYYLCRMLHLNLDLNQSIVFFALASPTDPVAVASIFKQLVTLPEYIKTRLIGEALFNDAAGILLLFSLLQFYSPNLANPTATEIILHILTQVVGAGLLGLAWGALTLKLMELANLLESGILITVASSGLGYILANYLHLSGVIVMVICGLYLSYRRNKAEQNVIVNSIVNFWGGVDSLLNALVFVLIGLETLTINFNLRSLCLAILAFLLINLARFISIYILDALHLVYFRQHKLSLAAMLVLSWGGVRGAVSLALALALSGGYSDIIPMTYLLVVMSIVIQGLTLPWLINKLKLGG